MKLFLVYEAFHTKYFRDPCYLQDEFKNFKSLGLVHRYLSQRTADKWTKTHQMCQGVSNNFVEFWILLREEFIPCQLPVVLQ